MQLSFCRVENIKLELKSNKMNKVKPIQRRLDSDKIIKSVKRKVGQPMKVVQFHGLKSIKVFSPNVNKLICLDCANHRTSFLVPPHPWNRILFQNGTIIGSPVIKEFPKKLGFSEDPPQIAHFYKMVQ